MKTTKIIYSDGVVERAVFADTAQALAYAAREARARGVFVRAQSCLAPPGRRQGRRACR